LDKTSDKIRFILYNIKKCKKKGVSHVIENEELQLQYNGYWIKKVGSERMKGGGEAHFYFTPCDKTLIDKQILPKILRFTQKQFNELIDNQLTMFGFVIEDIETDDIDRF
jgi:hypothetical protein